MNDTDKVYDPEHITVEQLCEELIGQSAARDWHPIAVISDPGRYEAACRLLFHLCDGNGEEPDGSPDYWGTDEDGDHWRVMVTEG
jgi:hypothetical protein